MKRQIYGQFATLMLVLWSACTTAATAPLPPTHPIPTEPLLQIDLGVHTGFINSNSVDAAGQLLLTASDDKTARLWSISDGRLLIVLRPPIDSGNDGTLNAAALSPDGHMAAVGGWTGASWDGSFSIYLFDTQTGRMMGRLSTGKYAPSELAFSPDGRFLVAGFPAESIRVWRTDNWTITLEDAKYRNSGIRGISFDRSGRLVIISSNSHTNEGFIDLYDSFFRYVANSHWAGRVPCGVSFSPDGSQIAVSFLGVNQIVVMSGQNLSLLFSPNANGTALHFTSVSWSADSLTLYASGSGDDGTKTWPIIRGWTQGGRGAYHDMSASNGIDMYSIKSLPRGGVVFIGMYGRWGTKGTATDIVSQGSIVEFRDLESDLLLSRDGSTIAFGSHSAHRGSLLWMSVMSLADRSLRSVAQPPAGLTPPALSTPSMVVTNWFWANPQIVGPPIPHPEWISQPPKLNGRLLEISKYDSQESTQAIAVRENVVLVGSSRGLHLFNQNGRLLWGMGTSSSPYAVNLSADGRLAVAAYDNGIIRWYRAKDGQELLAFLPLKDGRRWVLWTLSGYYDASPGGEDLIGWHVNRDKDQAADFYPASRFADTMRRPDIVGRILDTLDERQAVTLANAASGRKEGPITAQTVATLLPPALHLISAPTRFATDTVTISYSVEAPADAPMQGEPRVKVNGIWQPQSRAIRRGESGDMRSVVLVGLPPHDSTVELYAENRNATSPALTVPLTWDARASLAPGLQGAAANHKPRLFVLAIGVSQYQRPDLKLQFADHDAEKFVTAMQAQQGKEYAQVTAKLLVNEQATRAGVEASLLWFENQVAADDVGILFISGHGYLQGSLDYFFAPADFDPDRARETGVEYKSIRKALVHFGAAGNRAVLLVDTCYAGGALGSNLGASSGDAFVSSLGQEQYSVVALTASNGAQLSLEDSGWGGGAFTKALLEAVVEAKADPEQSGTITVLDLGRYVSKRVPVLTQKRQEPVLVMPSGGLADFPIAAR